MKRSEKLVKDYGLVAGVVSVAVAFLIVVFVLLAEIGCIYPRKIEITVATDDSTKIYDGTELTGGYSITYGKLIDGHKLEAISKSSLVDIGEIENNIEFIVVDSTGADVTNRYKIKYKYGKLSVTARPLSFKADNGEKHYDGTPLECPRGNIVYGSLVKGHTMHVKDYAQYTEVGEYTNTVSIYIIDTAGNDVTEYYDITTTPGKLKVHGIRLNISTGNLTKIYDGQPATNSEWSLTSGKLDAGDELRVVEVLNFDGVGTVDNVIAHVVIDKNGYDVTNKYDIKYQYGKITVTPVSISIITGSTVEKYTGKPIGCNTYSMVSGTLCDGHSLSITGRTRSNVGMTYNDVLSYTVTATMPDGTKKDVSNCYTLTYTSGTITVSPQ